MKLIKKSYESYNNFIDYFYLKNDEGYDIYIGNLSYIMLNLNTIFIKFLFINEEHRGKGYLKQFLEFYKSYNIKLEAKELMDKYNKLINHYINHGFKITNNKEHIHYDGDICYRKISMVKIGFST